MVGPCIKCNAYPLETSYYGYCSTCYIVSLSGRLEEAQGAWRESQNRIRELQEGLREAKTIALSIAWGHPPREEIIGSAKVIARRVDTLLDKEE